MAITAPQTTYNLAPAAGLPGMIADNTNKTVESKLAQGTVPIGFLVAPGTHSESAQLPAGNAQTPGQVQALPAGLDVAGAILNSSWLGVSLRDPMRMPTGADSYADKDDCSVLRIGRVWVNCTTAHAESADVYVRTTAGGGGLGEFGGAAAAGFSLLDAARARWKSASSAAGLAILELL